MRVRTYFEAFGTCFLVMDFEEGRSLASVLSEEPIRGFGGSRCRLSRRRLRARIGREQAQARSAGRNDRPPRKR